MNTVFVRLSSVYPSVCLVTCLDLLHVCSSVHLPLHLSVIHSFSVWKYSQVIFSTFPETMQHFSYKLYIRRIVKFKKMSYTLSKHSTSGLGHTRGLFLHRRQCWPWPASSRNTPDLSPKLCVHTPPSFLHLHRFRSNIFHPHRAENSIVALKKRD